MLLCTGMNRQQLLALVVPAALALAAIGAVTAIVLAKDEGPRFGPRHGAYAPAPGPRYGPGMEDRGHGPGMWGGPGMGPGRGQGPEGRLGGGLRPGERLERMRACLEQHGFRMDGPGAQPDFEKMREAMQACRGMMMPGRPGGYGR